MSLDECKDCERLFPGGEGLVDGLCTSCRDARERAKAESAAEPSAPNEPETETETETEEG